MAIETERGSRHVGDDCTALAGRTGVLELYPPSWSELQRFPSHPTALLEVLWSGAYPRIFDRTIPPQQWLADCVATYVQRDVRQLLNVGDLRAFTNFVRLAAGSTACEINLSRLDGDAGVSHNTVKAWLSVLEASYLFFRLPGWHTNARKQVVKSPKLHVFNSGLACYLLGIRSPEQLQSHPLRGAIFESWVAAELLKQGAHAGSAGSLWHYRDATRLEVDLVIDAPPTWSWWRQSREPRWRATSPTAWSGWPSRLSHRCRPDACDARWCMGATRHSGVARRRLCRGGRSIQWTGSGTQGTHGKPASCWTCARVSQWSADCLNHSEALGTRSLPSRRDASAPRQSFGQFDARARRIDQERELEPDPRHVAERHLKGDAISCELFGKRLQILHLKTDVVE